MSVEGVGKCVGVWGEVRRYEGCRGRQGEMWGVKINCGGDLGKCGERYGGGRKVCWVWGEVGRDVEKGIVWGVRGKVRVDVGVRRSGRRGVVECMG